jgi:hypothetical protein
MAKVSVMRIVDEEDRLPELRRLGLSPAMLRMAAAKKLPALFARLRVPYKVYRGMTWSGGPIFVPLWEKDDTTTAVRRDGDELVFFAFDVEAPSRRWSLARTEQGLLATLFFIPLNLWYDDPEDAGPGEHRKLRAAAKSIGFRFFDQADRVFREKYARGFDAFERAYKKLVRDIDTGAVSD